MSGKTGIQWTKYSWNPTIGCERVSAGCDNCYAFLLHDTRYASYLDGWVDAPKQYHRPFSSKWVDRATGKPQGIQLFPERLADPLRWREGARIFVNSMSDLWHEDIPDDFIAQVYGVMALTPRHTYQVLTKRPARMGAWAYRKSVAECIRAFTDDENVQATIGRATWRYNERLAPPNAIETLDWPLPNVWNVVSVEHQDALHERYGFLAATRTIVRGLSIEPMLGAIDLRDYVRCSRCRGYGVDTSALRPVDRICPVCNGTGRGLDWVILGGESGPRARKIDLDWFYDVIAVCRANGIAIFVKQLGSYWYRYTLGAHDKHGGDIEEWPEALRIREYPSLPSMLTTNALALVSR